MDELIALKPDLLLANPPEPAAGDRVVLVRGDSIEAVLPATCIPADARLLEFPGATLLPGLIDAHVHLTLCGCATPRQTMMQEDNEILLLRAAENARRALHAGITTLRDCGDRGGVTFTLRRAILQGIVPGPRLLLSGPPLTSPRGHCYFMGGEVEGRDHMARSIAGLAERGADFIKVMATGGGLTPGTDSMCLQFTPDELAFLVCEARKHNRYVAAHAHNPESIIACARASVHSIEHASFVNVEATQTLSSNNLVVVPTNVPAVHAVRAGRTLGLAREVGLTSQEFLDRRRRVLRDLVRSGVRVIAGTDAGATGVPFDSLPGEIEILAEAFGSIPRAIAAATSESADSLQIAGAGRIREGAPADLLIVRGDPARDLAALRDPLLVMARGRIL